MLREIHSINQVDGEPPRRWFAGPVFDLLVWQDQATGIVEFQLCYEQAREEHAICWRKDQGCTYCRIDSDEPRPGLHKASPVLQPQADIPAARIADEFRLMSRMIEGAVADFVHAKLLELMPA